MARRSARGAHADAGDRLESVVHRGRSQPEPDLDLGGAVRRQQHRPAVLARTAYRGPALLLGVKLVAAGETYIESASFVAQPIDRNGSYNGVTLITHGFDLKATTSDAAFQNPAQFIALARLIANAAGGGVVLLYNKNTGEWRDADGTAVGADVLQDGKAVVLVADWSKESDISDSGFSEAAAEALYTSLAALNRDSGNKLFSSPLHLIGHSRGTVVNSEIAQRLGVWHRKSSIST